MPILRWLGFSRVMSLPSTTIVPAVGSSKPATMRSTVVLPQPEGPRKETNSPCSTSRLKSWTTVVAPKDFLHMLDGEEWLGHGFDPQFGRFADFGAKRDRIWISAMQPQVMTKEMMASAAGS